MLVHNEYRAVRGRNNRTIVYLFVILFVAFLTFGFARNALNYQQKLSSDPFSNWINLNYHAGTGDSLRSLHEKISDARFRELFHIRGAYFYNKGMVAVQTCCQGRPVVQCEARTIDPASRVVSDLLNTSGTIRNYPDPVVNAFEFEPNGVIISGRLCDEAGLDKQTISFIRIKAAEGDFVPVPVLAVVSELPDLSDIVYSNLFYCKTMNTGFYDHDNSYYRIFIENMDTAGILRVLGELSPALGIQDPATVQTTRLITGNRQVMNWKIEVGAQDNPMPVHEMNLKVAGMTSLKGHHAGQYFELSTDTACDGTSFFHDYLAIEFSDLIEIREFSKYLKEQLNLQLNLEVLTARENYLYAGNLAASAIFLIMALAVLAVSVYLSSVIRNHILGIKKNLGNFMAFGVRNATLMRLYIFISVKILCMALVPAVFAAFCCGELFEHYFLGKVIVVEPGEDYFSLFNAWFAVFLLLVLIVAFFRTFVSVRKILKQTPGDLIYERDY